MPKFNPCNPCCTDACWFDKYLPLLPETLVGQSLIDGTFGGMTLVRTLDAGPFGGHRLYHGTFDVTPDGFPPCAPDQRIGPVTIEIYLDDSVPQSCFLKAVVTTPNFILGATGVEIGCCFIPPIALDGTNMAFYIGIRENHDETEPAIYSYLQSVIFAGSPLDTAGDVETPAGGSAPQKVTASVKIWRAELVYTSPPGTMTLTDGALVYELDDFPLYNLYGATGGRVPEDPTTDPTCVLGSGPPNGPGGTPDPVMVPSDRWVPAEWGVRPLIYFSQQLSAAAQFDLIEVIAGSGTDYDGWYVGFKVYLDGTTGFAYVQLDLGLACTFGSDFGGNQVEPIWTTTGPWNSSTIPPSDKTVSGPHIEFDGLGTVFRGYMSYPFESPYLAFPYPPLVVNNPDGSTTFTYDIQKIEIRVNA